MTFALDFVMGASWDHRIQLTGSSQKLRINKCSMML